MTEKRFESDGWKITDNETQKDIGMIEASNLLNELHEENQSLKFQLGECRNNKLFSRRQLEKENEQLKKENKTLADGLTAYFESKIKRG